MAEKRFITWIDPTLPAKQRAKLLQQMIDDIWDGLGDDEDFEFTQEDVELLQQYSRDKSYLVRSVAVGTLAEVGPCDWLDVERWVLDRSQHVRDNVVRAIGAWDYAANRLCAHDKERCVGLLAKAAERYVDCGAASALHDLCYDLEFPEGWPEAYVDCDTLPDLPERYFPEWVEVTWKAADGLLNLQREDVTLMLNCCYFEHVIPDNSWGPGDRHIRPWIEGADVQRKLVLLAIALWWGLHQGKMREITGVLSQDSDKAVAWIAKAILRGHAPHIELGMQHYEIVRKWLEKRSPDCQ